MRTQRLPLEEFLLIVWLGSLWTIGLLVAPLLFQLLPRADAGQVAGVLFQIGQSIAAGCAVILLILRWWPTRLRWLLVTLLVLTLVNLAAVMPHLAALRGGAAQGEGAFAIWHGISGSLYLLQCIGGLALLWLRRSAANS